MIKLEKKHVLSLEKYDADYFSDWFISGYRDMIDKEKYLDAFKPLNLFVGRVEVTSDLKDVYNLLSGSAKKKFCQGISIALSKIAKKYDNFELAKELLFLAGSVNAVQVISIILSQIANGFFGITDNEECEDLFAISLNIICGMAPYGGVRMAVYRMIASSNYRYEYAPMAFIGLCKTKSFDFPEYLDLLRSDIARFNCQYGEKSAYLTVLRFVQYVDAKTIADNLYKMKLTLNPEVEKSKTDNWFVLLIFLHEKSPLRLIKTEKSFNIMKKKDENSEEKKFDIKFNSNADNNYDLMLFFYDICYSKRYVTLCIEEDVENETLKNVSTSVYMYDNIRSKLLFDESICST